MVEINRFDVNGIEKGSLSEGYYRDKHRPAKRRSIETPRSPRYCGQDNRIETQHVLAQIKAGEHLAKEMAGHQKRPNVSRDGGDYSDAQQDSVAGDSFFHGFRLACMSV